MRTRIIREHLYTAPVRCRVAERNCLGLKGIRDVACAWCKRCYWCVAESCPKAPRGEWPEAVAL